MLFFAFPLLTLIFFSLSFIFVWLIHVKMFLLGLSCMEGTLHFLDLSKCFLSSTLEFRPCWPLWAESCCQGPQASSCPPSALNVLLTIWLIPTHPFTLASGTLPFLPMHLLPSFKVLTTQYKNCQLTRPCLHTWLLAYREQTLPLTFFISRRLAHNKKLLRT